MWCAKCYTSDPEVTFHINRPVDDEGVVWKRRKEVDRFTVARNGDHVVCPFQCDLCIFRLLKKRDPDPSSASDRLLLACIRRASLDAFHSREKRTVEGTFNAMKRAIALSEKVGLSGGYPAPGPFPFEDICGYEVAVQMLLASKKPGKNASTYTQFDTIRTYRTSFFGAWQVGQAARGTLLASTDEKGTFSRLGACPTQSLWFSKFLQGCRIRMGQLVIQDKAISVELLLAVIQVVDGRVRDAETLNKKAWWVSVGAYLTVGFCISLRGPEGFMLDLGALRKYLEKGRQGPGVPFVTIPLLGRFKGEEHFRQHLLFSAARTSSGFQPRKWLDGLVMIREQQGRTTGPAICDDDGYVTSQSTMNEAFRSCLEAVQEDSPDLFAPDQKITDFDIDRTLRRGSDSRAKALGVSADDINAVHRWERVERAKGKKPAQGMSDHYADVEYLRPMFIRYNQGL
jgi:hypothetical protein